MRARDPRQEPWPGDVLVFESSTMTIRHTVEHVAPIPGSQRRVTLKGQGPISIRQYRKWAGDPDVRVETAAQLWWDTARSSRLEYVSRPHEGLEFALEFYDVEPIGYQILRRPEGEDAWEILDEERLPTPRHAKLRVDALLRQPVEDDPFDVEHIAKAIAGNLLMADLRVEDLYPKHGDAIRRAMRRLGQNLLDEAGDAALQPMGFQLRPVGHNRAEIQLGDPLLMTKKKRAR